MKKSEHPVKIGSKSKYLLANLIKFTIRIFFESRWINASRRCPGPIADLPYEFLNTVDTYQNLSVSQTRKDFSGNGPVRPRLWRAERGRNNTMRQAAN